MSVVKKRRGRPPGRERLDPSITTIKKYGNRRLYDLRRSRYVTLEELADTIAAGEEVRIVDAKSNQDITKQVVTKIVFLEEERRGLELLPLSFLLKLIQHGESSLAIGAELEEIKSRILSLEARIKK